MKKIKLMIFFMSLVLGIFFFIPIKILAITSDENATDWYNYITQFEDGFATATFDTVDISDFPTSVWFTILIKQSPDNEYNGYYIQYGAYPQDGGGLRQEQYIYFEKDLADVISFWMSFGYNKSFDDVFEQFYNGESEYNGIIYWNFEEEYWQLEPYGEDEPDYFEQLYVKLVPAVITVITFASVLSMLVFKKERTIKYD